MGSITAIFKNVKQIMRNVFTFYSCRLCAIHAVPARLLRAIIMLCDRQNGLRGDAYNGLKSEAGCLHQGQIKLSGSVSLSWI